MREKVGLTVVKSLKRNDLGISHAAIDMLCALIQVGCAYTVTHKFNRFNITFDINITTKFAHLSQPMHDNYDLKQEQLNKTSVLSTKKFLENLLDIFYGHVVSCS